MRCVDKKKKHILSANSTKKNMIKLIFTENKGGNVSDVTFVNAEFTIFT